jgi:2,4-dienoyl-CoA reductase-like NADH-dependent reductase (Old Yellow Enzyme family)
LKPTAIPDPRKIIDQYKKAAELAKEAGFDGVERNTAHLLYLLIADDYLVHSANGYLPNQFLDADANKRTDEWGGSIENLTRFPLETLRAMISVWGKERVGIKVRLRHVCSV